MEPKAEKPKRQKKKKSRTEVFSSSSESETGTVSQSTKTVQKPPSANPGEAQAKAGSENAPETQQMSDSEVTAAFTKYYMQRATTEFADDLDRIRGADDFDDEAVQMLVAALRQGTGGFGMDEMRRVVQAARKG